jgi:hypothetical protein
VRTNCFADASPANCESATLGFVEMVRDHDGNDPFWTASGGAVQQDVGAGVPQFAGEIVLRGGKFECNFHNQETSDLKVKIWTGFTVARPDNDPVIFPATPVDAAWDPTLQADFQKKFAKVRFAREVIVEGGNSYNFVTRIRVQKVDKVLWNPGSTAVCGLHPILLYTLCSVGHENANAVSITKAFNISFSADAVTPAS